MPGLTATTISPSESEFTGASTPESTEQSIEKPVEAAPTKTTVGPDEEGARFKRRITDSEESETVGNIYGIDEEVSVDQEREDTKEDVPEIIESAVVTNTPETSQIPTTLEPTNETTIEPKNEAFPESNEDEKEQPEKRHLLSIYNNMGNWQMIALIILLAAMFAILCMYKHLLLQNKRIIRFSRDEEDTTIDSKALNDKDRRG